MNRQVTELERRKRAWLRGFFDGVAEAKPARMPADLLDHYQAGRQRGAIARGGAMDHARSLYGDE